MKKGPQITFGDFQIQYQQIPYDDRYFVITYKEKEVARIPYYLYKRYGFQIFPAVFIHNQYDKATKNWLAKVEKYNEYLDEE